MQKLCIFEQEIAPFPLNSRMSPSLNYLGVGDSGVGGGGVQGAPPQVRPKSAKISKNQQSFLI